MKRAFRKILVFPLLTASLLVFFLEVSITAAGRGLIAVGDELTRLLSVLVATGEKYDNE